MLTGDRVQSLQSTFLGKAQPRAQRHVITAHIAHDAPVLLEPMFQFPATPFLRCTASGAERFGQLHTDCIPGRFAAEGIECTDRCAALGVVAVRLRSLGAAVASFRCAAEEFRRLTSLALVVKKR